MLMLMSIDAAGCAFAAFGFGSLQEAAFRFPSGSSRQKCVLIP
jgi:hypothetical protein